MNKRYIKPETMISEIEMNALCNLEYSGTYADPNAGGRAKGRGFMDEEEEWVKDVDMWGNESWSRTR